MTSLSEDQKQLLFDYCMGLASQAEADEARRLISSSEEAAEIHSKLKSALSPLANLEPVLSGRPGREHYPATQ